MSFFASGSRKLTGRHVAIAFVAFFAAIFAVNGVFLYVSLSSHPGVTSGDAYREGLKYNREIEAADRQKALGWRTAVTAERGIVALTLHDRSGAAVHGADVALTIRRPAHDGADTARATREIGPGLYAATQPVPDAGRWLLRFDIRKPGGAYLRVEEEVFVSPEALR